MDKPKCPICESKKYYLDNFGWYFAYPSHCVLYCLENNHRYTLSVNTSNHYQEIIKRANQKILQR